MWRFNLYSRFFLTQIRQWQHWGSGCYNVSFFSSSLDIYRNLFLLPPQPFQFECRDGYVHLQINNYTFTCFHANQEITIQLFFSGWLHKGTILCPNCTEICQVTTLFPPVHMDQISSFYFRNAKMSTMMMR